MKKTSLKFRFWLLSFLFSVIKRLYRLMFAIDRALASEILKTELERVILLRKEVEYRRKKKMAK